MTEGEAFVVMPPLDGHIGGRPRYRRPIHPVLATPHVELVERLNYPGDVFVQPERQKDRSFLGVDVPELRLPRRLAVRWLNYPGEHRKQSVVYAWDESDLRLYISKRSDLPNWLGPMLWRQLVAADLGLVDEIQIRPPLPTFARVGKMAAAMAAIHAQAAAAASKAFAEDEGVDVPDWAKAVLRDTKPARFP